MTSLLGLSQAMLCAVAVQTAPRSGAQPPTERPHAATPARTPRPSEGWTWTLYSGDGPLVLANEIPDTPRLRTTLECAPGSSVVRLAFHDAPGADGFATIRTGAASAEVEARARRGRLEAVLRADHPVFAAFLATGRLTVTLSEPAQTIEIDPANLPKLRRFAELCAG